LRLLLGRDVEWSTVDPSDTPVVPYLKQVVTDPKNYLLLLLAFVSFVTGNALFIGVVVWFAFSLSLVTAPAVYWIDGIRYFNAPESIDIGITMVSEGQLVISTLPEALLVALMGIILTVVGFHLINLTTRVYADITEVLLPASQ